MKNLRNKRRIAERRPAAIPDEFIVKMRAPESACQLCNSKALAANWQIESLPLKGNDTVLIRTSPGAAPAKHGARLKTLLTVEAGEIEYSHPNYLWYPDRKPKDPRYRDEGMWGLRKVGAPAAWERTTGDKGVIIAVIDSGIDYKHEDLKDNLWTNAREAVGSTGGDDDGNGVKDDLHGADFAGRTSGDPMDRDGHGTHVAGTIAAAGSDDGDAKGVVGMNWRASLMALKYCEGEGGGSTAAAVRAINYAVRMGAVIINASWSGPSSDPTLRRAIDEARENNVLFVASAGQRFAGGGMDTDQTPCYPAGYELDNIIGVQSSSSQDELMADSNFGRTSVDIAAPGSGILSTLPGNEYGLSDGTSMATPHVAGAAALIKSLAPDWGYLEIKQQLLGTAKRLPAFKNKSVSGGRLNVDAATQAPLVITGPARPDSWRRGESAVVRWRQKFAPFGCRHIDLAISTDGGNTWETLASNVDVTLGALELRAPDLAAEGVRVRAGCTGTRLYAYSHRFAIA